MLAYMFVSCLETVKNDIFSVTNFLIDQEVLDVCSLISGQLNDISYFGILLNGPVTTKVLFECLANSFRVQVVRQTSDGGDTLSSVTLLHSDVNLFLSGTSSGVVPGVLKGIFLFVHEVLNAYYKQQGMASC